MSVELTAVCTLSALKTAVLHRTPGPDSYCFAPCTAIYSAERKGQAGAELLHCPGERACTGHWASGESGKGALGVPGAFLHDLIDLLKDDGSNHCTCTTSALEEPLQLKRKRWPQVFLILKLQRCESCGAAVLGIICCVPVEHAGEN